MKVEGLKVSTHAGLRRAGAAIACGVVSRDAASAAQAGRALVPVRAAPPLAHAPERAARGAQGLPPLPLNSPLCAEAPLVLPATLLFAQLLGRRLPHAAALPAEGGAARYSRALSLAEALSEKAHLSI